MERVVDLIDRQARLITGEKRLPVDDYVYAKNQHESTYFRYDPTSGTYYTTLKARYPAIDNYYIFKKDTYTDGVIGVYHIFGLHRYRIGVGDVLYGKYNPNDADPADSTITFYNIPERIIKEMYEEEYIKESSQNPSDYVSLSQSDYHRDYIAGEEP
jgi:hypothetical protein